MFCSSLYLHLCKFTYELLSTRINTSNNILGVINNYIKIVYRFFCKKKGYGNVCIILFFLGTTTDAYECNAVNLLQF